MLKRLPMWLLSALLLLALAIGAQAQTVSTDKADYPPGSTVQITGSGFHANENVTLEVDATDGLGWDYGQPWTTTTDDQGNFTSSWYVVNEAANRAFILTADCQHDGPDPAHLHAECLFTDATNTNTVLTSSGSPSGPGQSVTFTATVSQQGNGNPITVGAVTFKEGATTLSAPTNLNASGQATFNISSLAVGSHTITAFYGGSGSINASNGSFTQSVLNIAVVTVGSTPNPSTFGQSVTFSGKLTNNGANFGGQLITLKDGTTTLGTDTTTNGGTYSISVSTLTVGTHNITANYGGDSTHTASTDSVSQVVNKATPVITWATPTAITYGTALSATQLNASASVPGTFTYTPASGTILGAGTQTLSVSFVPTDTTDYNNASANVSLVVNKKALTITADDKTRLYGAANPTLTASYSGFISGESETSLSTPVTLTTTAAVGSPVANYPIQAAGATSSNYLITFVNGTLSVTKAPLTIKADDKTKAYGTANPPFTSTITGAKNGDTFSVTYSTPAVTGSGVGSYAITPSVTAGRLGNYTATFQDGSLSVTPIALSVTANSKSRKYGDVNPTLDGTLTGVLAGDGITASYTTTATPASPVGTYAITATLSDPNTKLGNYTVTNNSGTLTVTKANSATALVSSLNPSTYNNMVTLTATVTPEIGQVPTGTVSFLVDGVQVGALVNLDATGKASIGVSTMTAGTHNLTAAYTGDTNFNNSSTISPVSQVVNKAVATVNLSGLSGVYNGSSHSVTAATVPAGLSVSITYAGSPSAPVNAGSYAIVATVSDNNYAGSATGTLVVDRATPTVTVSVAGSPFTYDSNPHAATASVAGVAGDSLTIPSSAITYNGAAGAPVNAGSYSVVATFAQTTNYNQATGTATLVINKATANISLSDLMQTYDGSAKSATVTKNPSDLTGVSVTYGGNAAAPVNAGTYAVVAHLVNDNYLAIDATGDLVIAKANQTIDFTAIPDHHFGDVPFTVSATASSNLPVTFTVDSTVTVSGNQITVPGTGIKSKIITVTAHQDGKALPTDTVQNYNPASFDRTFLLIENTAPIASASPDNTDWHRTQFDVTLSATDDGGDGVASITYKINGGSDQVVHAVSVPISISDSSVNQGDNVITYFALDSAGNKSTVNYVHVNWDTAGPVIDKGVRDPDYTIGGVKFYTAPLPINFSATDATSGLAGPATAALGSNPILTGYIYGTPADQQEWDTMAGLVSISATDVAGNSSQATISFQYDTKKPVITVNGVSDMGFSQTAAPIVSVSDPGRPTAKLETHIYASLPNLTKGAFYDIAVSPDKFAEISDADLATAFAAEGNYTLVVESKDEVGVAGASGHSASKTVHFTVDKTAPQIVLDSMFPLDNSVSNLDQLLKYWMEDLLDPSPIFTLEELFSQMSGGDDTIGIASPKSVSAEGVHKVRLEGKDHANNIATPVERTFKIDKTAPVSDGPVVSGSAAPAAGWYQTAPSIALSATDPYIRPGGANPIAGSGVQGILWYSTGASVQGSLASPMTYNSGTPPVVSTQGVTQFYYWAVDAAGNAEAAHTIPIRFDSVPPVLTVPTSPVIAVATSENGALVNFTVSATDNVTIHPAIEVTPAQYQSGATFPVGDTTVFVKATDEAGFVTSKSFVVHVDNPVPSIATIAPASQTYNPAAANLTLTVNGSGFMPGGHSIVKFTSGMNSEDLVTTWVSFTKLTAVIPKEKLHGGVYGITVFTGTPGGGTSNSNTFTVTKADQTITFDALAGKTYGDAPFTIDATSDSGLPVSFAVKSGPASISGNTVSITGAGTVVICASQAGNDDYNAAPKVDQSFVVAKATPTIQLTGGGTFTYDANVHTATATVTGVNGDSLNAVVTYNGTSNAPLNAGNYDVLAKFTANANYNGAEASTTIKICKANQVITWNNPADIVYGTALSATQLNASVSSPDSTHGAITYSPAAGAVLHVDTGTHTLTVNVAGTDNLNPATANVTIHVLKATPVVSAEGGTFTYDRQPHPAVVGITGVNEDTLALSSVTYTPGGIDAPVNVHVGGYDVLASFSGSDDYFPASMQAHIDINPAALTVIVANKTKEYGEDNPALTGTVTGIITGDEAAIVVAYNTTAVKASNFGTYPITAEVTGAAFGNYALSNTAGTLTVTKAPLSVTPNDKSREYGDANPALDGTILGIKNGDGITATYATVACATSNIGSYDITATLTGDKLGNYDVTNKVGKLTVTAAPLTIKADDKSKVYGNANPTFSSTITGTKNMDTFTVTYSTSASPASVVGSYPVTPSATGAKLGNYTVTYTDGSLSVTKRPLVITADDKTKVYGTTNPTFTGTANVGGLANSDTVTSLGVVFNTPANTQSPVNAYPITPSGGNDTNYSISYVAGTLTITKAPLTVKADDKTMIIGGTPVLTYSVTGLVGTDTADSVFQTKPTLSTTANSSSDIGTYPITVGGGVSQNYSVSYSPGTLLVVYGTNSGVLQPLNQDGSSVNKQGSTIPVKFQVFDANGNSVGPGPNGLCIVSSFTLVQTLSGTAVDVINEDILSTTPDTQFRWDATAKQWIFNLSTKNLTAKKTYTYRIVLRDGSVVGGNPVPAWWTGAGTVSFRFGLK